MINNDEFEDDEFEDNEFEDNEFEDDEFEDDEFEDDEFEDNEFEDDEVVKGEVVKENILSNESNQLDDEFMKNLKLSKDKLDEIDPIIPINSIVNKGENNINITFNSEDTTRNIEQIKLKNFNQVTYTESSTQNREENKEVVKHLTKIGKTQEEIATYLGCSQSSVSLYLDEIKEEKNTN
ncbi:hypothetical protein [Aliarcobacter cryaerophilus]|uniref:hypothetical protein n=1 Tax=Aliarcobacter cryaerophilus TaxID=28198 RepID=UPI003DA2D2B7